MSQITVRYFAAAAEASGVAEERIALGGETTLEALRSALTERYGGDMARVLRAGSFLVNGTVRRDGGPIADAGSSPVVDVLPPFAGG